MTILNDNDIELYAPSLVDQMGSTELLGKISYIQQLIESDLGCNREIEKKVWTDKIKYKYSDPYNNSIFLVHFPIDLTYTPTVKITKSVRPVDRQVLPYFSSRYNSSFYTDGWGRSYSLDSETLTANDYYLDTDGELQIVKPLVARDITVTYQGGLDFTQNTREIQNFKAAAGKLLEYVENSQSYEGIEEVQVPFDEYRIKYNTRNSSPYVVPEQLMVYFKRYRPNWQNT